MQDVNFGNSHHHSLEQEGDAYPFTWSSTIIGPLNSPFAKWIQVQSKDNVPQKLATLVISPNEYETSWRKLDTSCKNWFWFRGKYSRILVVYGMCSYAQGRHYIYRKWHLCKIQFSIRSQEGMRAKAMYWMYSCTGTHNGRCYHRLMHCSIVKNFT